MIDISEVFFIEPIVVGDYSGFLFESFNQKRVEEAVGVKPNPGMIRVWLSARQSRVSQEYLKMMNKLSLSRPQRF